MRSASVHEIKQELLTLKPAELVELCLRLAKFKKENKELLNYLLFEAQDEQGAMPEEATNRQMRRRLEKAQKNARRR